jgi:hypothetical protein
LRLWRGVCRDRINGPKGEDHNVYLITDDCGRNGGVDFEADVKTADLETVILDPFEGQYKSLAPVFGLNTAENWLQDVSGGVAQEPRRPA